MAAPEQRVSASLQLLASDVAFVESERRRLAKLDAEWTACAAAAEQADALCLEIIHTAPHLTSPTGAGADSKAKGSAATAGSRGSPG